jgi:Suppressor of fused protein (SUFU)
MHVLGELAERLRGECPFVFGSTIDIGGTITDETEMTAFVVCPPAVLDPDDYEHVEVGDGRGINIVGVYPIHPSERRFIDGHGVNEFSQLNWDPFDVTRASIV